MYGLPEKKTKRIEKSKVKQGIKNGGGEQMNYEPHFNGSDYQPSLDFNRLTGQIKRIKDCMMDGIWRTLGEIEEITGDPQASISAQLRHLRKPRFGEYTVEKRRRSKGTFEYRVSK